MSVFEGEIENSKYKIIVPEKPTGNIHIFCHGYRPKGIPLQALLNENSLLNKFLLGQGWIISATSYRREGYIIKDALDDCNNLRKFIIDKFCKEFDKEKYTGMVVLEAESMGGRIVTFINELFPNLYSGLFAHGAALIGQDDPPEKPLKYQYNPSIPLMYLSGTSESSQIEQYIKECEKNKAKEIPALWTIDREGHCSATQKEILISFTALLDWIQNGEIEKEFNVTQPEEYFERKSEVEFDEKNHCAYGKVIEIDEYGEFMVNFTYEDMKKLFIFQKTKFMFSTGDKDIEILFDGFPFVGVEFDSWVSGMDQSGFLKIRKHYSGNNVNMAAKESGVKVGDKVCIKEKMKQINKGISSSLQEKMKLLGKN